jgi:hypothetical protein
MVNINCKLKDFCTKGKKLEREANRNVGLLYLRETVWKVSHVFLDKM